MSWDKSAPSRIWYNDSPYILYESLIVSTSTPTLGYCSISEPITEGFKRYEASGLLDCIIDGYYGFIPATVITFSISGITSTFYFG